MTMSVVTIYLIRRYMKEVRFYKLVSEKSIVPIQDFYSTSKQMLTYKYHPLNTTEMIKPCQN